MSTIATQSHRPFGPALLAGAVLSAICISPGSTQAQPDVPQANTQAATATPHRHWHQLGKASWYGGMFQGQATASGEPYDMNSMTCAHRSLPPGHRSFVRGGEDFGVPRRRPGAARPG